MMAVSMGTQALAGGVKAYGSYEQGQAQSKAYAYQAHINDLNASYASQEGNAKATRQGMKNRAQVGQIRAAQGANGIDVNTGSAAQVRSATEAIGMLDAMTIRSDEARKAYGLETQAELDRSASKQAKTAGTIGAVTSLLGTASSMTGAFSKWQGKAGGGGSGNSANTLATEDYDTGPAGIW